MVIREPPGTTETSTDVDNELIERSPKVEIKPGLKLPKLRREWDTANDYFKAHIDHTTPITNVDNIITSFNDIVYGYFNDTQGTVVESAINSEFKT